MRVTFFTDLEAATREERDLTFVELAELIRDTSGSSKYDLPLLKLATFGDQLSKKGSLRHDKNVLLVHGLECDYDAEIVSFTEAVGQARAVGVQAILYTSPSHTIATPRWRALFPFAGQMLPPGRGRMADRANAIFKGVLARETWTLSQSYYFGRTGADFELVVLDGAPLDTLSEDAEEQPFAPGRASAAVARHVRPQSIEDLPSRVKRAIKSGDPKKFGHPSRSHMVFFVACALARCGWSEERIVDVLVDPEYPISAHVREQGNGRQYARRQAHDAHAKTATDWITNTEGVILPNNQRNLSRALGELGARFSWNVFTGRGYVNGVGPLRSLDDHEVNELRLAVDREFGFLPSKDLFYDYLDHLTHLDPVHPVREYLTEVQTSWDGIERLGGNVPSWLTTYCGAEDNAYTRAVGRLIMVAACRRVRQPGCKFDEMLVLVSPEQGTEKSRVVGILARQREWFTDSMPLAARDKEVIEHLAGRWIVENAELNGIRQNQVEEIKSFMSRQVDRARLAYGRLSVDAPRQCVFFGTTNSEAFLRDNQNRRFWPVRVSYCDHTALERDIDQLWAEAATAEAAGESIRLERKLWAVAAEVQWEYRQEDSWSTEINETLRDMNGKISTTDVWKIIGKPVHQRSQPDNARLGEAMRELGFLRRKARAYGRLQWCYVRQHAEGSWGEPQIIVLRDPVTGDVSAHYESEIKAAGLGEMPKDEEIPF